MHFHADDDFPGSSFAQVMSSYSLRRCIHLCVEPWQNPHSVTRFPRPPQVFGKGVGRSLPVSHRAAHNADMHTSYRLRTADPCSEYSASLISTIPREDTP